MKMQHAWSVSRLAPASLACLAIALSLSGCGFGSSVKSTLLGDNTAKLGEPTPAPGVFGYAVADEPEAALAARAALNEGGNAADAAASAGFALAVTLPSRAGLGGGGACLISEPGHKPVALSFLPGAGTQAAGADRPAAVPEMARGLVALQARYGVLPLPAVLAPAEHLAGAGVPVSRALAADLNVVGNALLADPAARAVFAPDGAVLAAGQTLRQPGLAASLIQLQQTGVLGFYQGQFAGTFVHDADEAGGGLTLADMQNVVPAYLSPAMAQYAGQNLYFLPAPADPQNQTLADFESLAHNAPPAPADSGALPASAGFAALDDKGGIVACAVTMDNLFGTGRIAGSTGILLAAAPRRMPVLAAGIATSPAGDFRAAATGTGQNQAALAAATGLFNTLGGSAPAVPDPGRTNIISCPGHVPGGEKSCIAIADPRGLGLASGG